MMTQTECDSRLAELAVVPVVKITDAAHAAPLARALLSGDLPVAEITFRTDQAAASIAAIADQDPAFLVGAGTVRSVEQATAAVDAGAQFVVSPGFNPAVVDWCLQRKVPVYPGVTGTEGMEMGLARGLTTLKFFPAGAYGGVAVLKALYAPYSDVKFMPTGGVSPDNLAEYLRLANVVACGGSWLTPAGAMEAGEWDRISALAQEARAVVRTVRQA